MTFHRSALLDDSPVCPRCYEPAPCTRCDPVADCNGLLWLELACALAIIVIFAVTNIALWRL